MVISMGHLCCLLGLWPLQTTTAQSIWEGLNMPGNPTPGHYVFGDTTNGTVYYCGFGSVGVPGSPGTIFSWKNGDWDTLGTTDGPYPRSMIRYHDTLIVAGDFYHVDTVTARIAAYDGAHWLPYGSSDNRPVRLRIIDDTLYVVGWFTQIDGVPIQAAAKRVGNGWVAVGTSTYAEFSMYDIARYGNELIGVGSSYPGLPDRFYHLVNGAWQVLLPGIVGTFSGGVVMSEYHGDLYIGGSIMINEGNAGQGIMRWDGSAFHPVGMGLQALPGNNSSYCGALNLIVHNDLLYVVNGCDYAGGLYAPGLATWDGAHWCAAKGIFNANSIDRLNDLDFLNDTAYAACGAMVDGVNVHYAARAPVSALIDTCAGAVGIASTSGTAPFGLFNSATGEWSFTGLHAGSYRTILYDAIGRTVRTATVQSTGPEDRIPFETTGLASGQYVLGLGDRHLQLIIP